MNSLDPVELLKNTPESNVEDWLKETDIVSYGAVAEVIGKSLCMVQQIVREGISKKFMVVPVLSIASGLFEESAEPKKGDLVLLLFVNKYNRAMFENAVARFALTGDWGFQDSDAVGYNKVAGIGLLLAPYTGLAETTIKHYMDGEDPAVLVRSRSKWTSTFRREFRLLFDSLPGNGSFVDRLVRFTFGQHSPHLVEHWASVTRKYGFSVLPDKTLETVTAPVTEVFSTMAPITKDIRGTQSITIGKGTNPAGDPAGSPIDTHAPVTITIGGDADISLTSESGATIHFDKPLTITCSKKITIDGQDIVEILAGTAKLSKIGNNLDTIGTLLDALITALIAGPTLVTPGTSGVISPAVASALSAIKARVDAVFN